MNWIRKVARGETHIDFVGRRRLWFRLSLSAILVALVSLGFRQLNLGIEFRGGLTVNATNSAGATIEELRAVTDQVGVSDAIIQLINNGAAFRVQTPALAPAIEDTLIDRLALVTGTARTEVSVDAVGPTFGALILRRSLLALVVFLVAVAAFMSWRLEWKMAGAGLAALVHDLILTVGVYSLTGFEVTPATVVALLTILGYSLYDTVVVFDKVSELAAEHESRMNYSDIVNRAMNLVLGRSLNTSLTSLLPVGSILFVGSFLLGASTLKDFALALFVGLAASTYSSIFVAAPLLAMWKEQDEEWVTRRRQLESKTTPATSTIVEAAARGSRPDRPAPKPRSRPAPRPPKGRR